MCGSLMVVPRLDRTPFEGADRALYPDGGPFGRERRLRPGTKEQLHPG
jgi:hypothetical protein